MIIKKGNHSGEWGWIMRGSWCRWGYERQTTNWFIFFSDCIVATWTELNWWLKCFGMVPQAKYKRCTAHFYRTDVVKIFPSADAYTRLATIYLMEYAEDWSASRSYLDEQSVDNAVTGDLTFHFTGTLLANKSWREHYSILPEIRKPCPFVIKKFILHHPTRWLYSANWCRRLIIYKLSICSMSPPQSLGYYPILSYTSLDSYSVADISFVGKAMVYFSTVIKRAAVQPIFGLPCRSFACAFFNRSIFLVISS